MGQGQGKGRNPTITSQTGELQKSQQCLKDIQVGSVFTLSNYQYSNIQGYFENGKLKYFVRDNSIKLWKFLDQNQSKVQCVIGGRGVGKSSAVYAFLMDQATNHNKSFIYLQEEMNNIMILKKFQQQQSRVAQVLFKDQKFDSENEFFQFIKSQLGFQQDQWPSQLRMDYVVIDGVSQNLMMYLYHFLKDLPHIQIIFISQGYPKTLSNQFEKIQFFYIESWSKEDYIVAIQQKCLFHYQSLKRSFENIEMNELGKKFYYAGGCLSLFFYSDFQMILDYYSNLLLTMENFEEIIHNLVVFKRNKKMTPNLVSSPLISLQAGGDFDLLSEGLTNFLCAYHFADLKRMSVNSGGISSLWADFKRLQECMATENMTVWDSYDFMQFLAKKEQAILISADSGELWTSFQPSPSPICAIPEESFVIFDETEISSQNMALASNFSTYFPIKYELVKEQHLLAIQFIRLSSASTTTSSVDQRMMIRLFFYFPLHQTTQQATRPTGFPSMETFLSQLPKEIFGNHSIESYVISNSQQSFSTHGLLSPPPTVGNDNHHPLLPENIQLLKLVWRQQATLPLLIQPASSFASSSMSVVSIGSSVSSHKRRFDCMMAEGEEEGRQGRVQGQGDQDDGEDEEDSDAMSIQRGNSLAPAGLANKRAKEGEGTN
jgi:hypothetical protein